MPEWQPLASRLSTPELEWLIRVLVTAEREFHWRDGSVASGVWLFRIYQERDDGDVDKLADWILRNRGNDWLPFGDYTGARSLDEWRSGSSGRRR